MSQKHERAADRLIVAVDVPSRREVRRLLNALDPVGIKRVKIGLEAFHAAGPALVRDLCREGYQVFLDLKYHDIPNTVGRTVELAAQWGVWMFNLHISGGAAMMKAARRALPPSGPRLIGVTVLTSLKTGTELVVERAQQASECGLHGVVASAREAAAIRKAVGNDLLIVTPGIRPAPLTPAGPGLASTDDQKRTATPEQAIRAGSDYLVIGRPITQAASPAGAARRIIDEIGKGR